MSLARAPGVSSSESKATNISVGMDNRSITSETSISTAKSRKLGLIVASESDIGHLNPIVQVTEPVNVDEPQGTPSSMRLQALGETSIGAGLYDGFKSLSPVVTKVPCSASPATQQGSLEYDVADSVLHVNSPNETPSLDYDLVDGTLKVRSPKETRSLDYDVVGGTLHTTSPLESPSLNYDTMKGTLHATSPGGKSSLNSDRQAFSAPNSAFEGELDTGQLTRKAKEDDYSTVAEILGNTQGTARSPLEVVDYSTIQGALVAKSGGKQSPFFCGYDKFSNASDAPLDSLSAANSMSISSSNIDNYSMVDDVLKDALIDRSRSLSFKSDHENYDTIDGVRTVARGVGRPRLLASSKSDQEIDCDIVDQTLTENLSAGNFGSACSLKLNDKDYSTVDDELKEELSAEQSKSMSPSRNNKLYGIDDNGVRKSSSTGAVPLTTDCENISAGKETMKKASSTGQLAIKIHLDDYSTVDEAFLAASGATQPPSMDDEAADDYSIVDGEVVYPAVQKDAEQQQEVNKYDVFEPKQSTYNNNYIEGAKEKHAITQESRHTGLLRKTMSKSRKNPIYATVNKKKWACCQRDIP